MSHVQNKEMMNVVCNNDDQSDGSNNRLHLLEKANEHRRKGNSLWMSDKKYEEAAIEYKKCLVIRESILGRYHEDTAIVYEDIGDCYYHQSNYKTASKKEDDNNDDEEEDGEETNDDTYDYYNNSLKSNNNKNHRDNDNNLAITPYRTCLRIRKYLNDNKSKTTNNTLKSPPIVEESKDNHENKKNENDSFTSSWMKESFKAAVIAATTNNNSYDEDEDHNMMATTRYNNDIDTSLIEVQIQWYDTKLSISTKYEKDGDLHRCKGNYSKAIEQYEMCIALEKECIGNEIILAYLYRKIACITAMTTNNTKTANKNTTNNIDENNTNNNNNDETPEIDWNQMDHIRGHNNNANINDEENKLNSSSSSFKRPWFHNVRIGDLYYQEFQYEKAIEQYQKNCYESNTIQYYILKKQVDMMNHIECNYNNIIEGDLWKNIMVETMQSSNNNQCYQIMNTIDMKINQMEQITKQQTNEMDTMIVGLQQKLLGDIKELLLINTDQQSDSIIESTSDQNDGLMKNVNEKLCQIETDITEHMNNKMKQQFNQLTSSINDSITDQCDLLLTKHHQKLLSALKEENNKRWSFRWHSLLILLVLLAFAIIFGFVIGITVSRFVEIETNEGGGTSAMQLKPVIRNVALQWRRFGFGNMNKQQQQFQ